VTGIVKLPAGTEMVMPGDNVSCEVELIVPIAMEEKLRFAIREGGVRRRRRRCKNYQVSRPVRRNSRHAKSEYPHQAESLRPPISRQFDAGDRQHGKAHRRAGAGPIPLPTGIERFTVNRSAHVDKKSANSSKSDA